MSATEGRGGGGRPHEGRHARVPPVPPIEMDIYASWPLFSSSERGQRPGFLLVVAVDEGAWQF